MYTVALVCCELSEDDFDTVRDASGVNEVIEPVFGGAFSLIFDPDDIMAQLDRTIGHLELKGETDHMEVILVSHPECDGIDECRLELDESDLLSLAANRLHGMTKGQSMNIHDSLAVVENGNLNMIRELGY